jgi:invasion protein IalB
MIRSIPIVAAVVVLLASALPGQAQTAMPRQEFKDWRYQCIARGADAGAAAAGASKQVCMIQHDVRNGNKLLMAARVRLIGAQKQAVLILLLPPNLQAKAPVGLSIDQGAAATAEVRECNKQICMAVVTIDDAMLGSLKAGQQLAVITKPGGVESTRTVSLAGFTSAFAALQAAPQ